jgi:hypothetical protein
MNPTKLTISFLLLLVTLSFYISSSHAQVPTLTPEQTVNPSTGRMEFSLPLATIKGKNGNDFPLALNYQSGIRLHDEASAFGLGFSCIPGAVTRIVVMVPDQANSAISLGDITYMYNSTTVSAETKEWFDNLLLVSLFIGGIIAVPLSFLPGSIAFIVGFAFSFGSGALISHIGSESPKNFINAGEHLPKYPLQCTSVFHPSDGSPAQHSAVDPNYSVGFFKGNTADLPDIYSISTPFISGSLIWVGGWNTGHFELRTSSGGQYPVKVSIPNTMTSVDPFIVTLPNGTRLVFEDAARSDVKISNYATDHTETHFYGVTNDYYMGTNADIWLLTKIIYPDFDGDEDDLLSTNNKGSYIKIEYDTYSSSDQPGFGFLANRFTYSSQTSPNSMSEQTTLMNEKHLAKIYTPEQVAVFDYELDRRDNLQFDMSDDGGRFDEFREQNYDNNGNPIDENRPIMHSLRYYTNSPLLQPAELPRPRIN